MILAWVGWSFMEISNIGSPTSPTTVWRMLDSYETKAECARGMDPHVKLLERRYEETKKGKTELSEAHKVKGGVVTVSKDKVQIVTTYECWPSGTDPRVAPR